MLKLTTDKHEALRGLSATAELLVGFFCHYFKTVQNWNRTEPLFLKNWTELQGGAEKGGSL